MPVFRLRYYPPGFSASYRVYQQFARPISILSGFSASVLAADGEFI